MERSRLSGMLDDIAFGDMSILTRSLVAGFEIVPLTDAVLTRASQPIGVVVRTLDAIHLASAAAVRTSGVPDLVFATHDQQQARGARMLGFDVIGVDG